MLSSLDGRLGVTAQSVSNRVLGLLLPDTAALPDLAENLGDNVRAHINNKKAASAVLDRLDVPDVK